MVENGANAHQNWSHQPAPGKMVSADCVGQRVLQLILTCGLYHTFTSFGKLLPEVSDRSASHIARRCEDCRGPWSWPLTTRGSFSSGWTDRREYSE